MIYYTTDLRLMKYFNKKKGRMAMRKSDYDAVLDVLFGDTSLYHLDNYPDEDGSRVVIPGISRIFFNNKHTTIEWADGEKTTVGCIEGQVFDEYSGFAAAVLKRLFGSSRKAVRFMDEHKVVQTKPVKKAKAADMKELK